MRAASGWLCLFAALPRALAAAGVHSLPEDPYAFPKFRVLFLNGLPLLNDTAEKWLREGLHGGEAEFLDKPWTESAWDTPHRQLKEIGSGTDGDVRLSLTLCGCILCLLTLFGFAITSRSPSPHRHTILSL
jgi:hypothetical protein